MLKLIFSISFVSIVLQFHAQELTSTEILLSNLDRINDVYRETSIPELGNIGIIDKMEFRTETDEWNIKGQEYTFRVSFNELNTSKTANRFKAISQQNLDLFKSEAIENLLLNSYLNLIEIKSLQKLEEVFKNEILLLNDRQKILEFEIRNTDKTNVENLFELSLRRNKIQLELEEIQLFKSQLWENLGFTFKNEELPKLISNNWLEPKKAIEHLLSIQESSINNLDMQFKLNRIENRKLDLELEQGKSKRILDYLQLRYNGEDEDLGFGNELSLGFGINIPTKQFNARRINESLVDISEEESELNRIRSKVNQDIISKKQKINLLYKKHKLYDSFLNEEKFKNVDSEINLLIKENLIATLEIKKAENEIKKELIEIENDLLTEYIEYIYIIGYLFQHPEKDFLDNSTLIK